MITSKLNRYMDLLERIEIPERLLVLVSKCLASSY